MISVFKECTSGEKDGHFGFKFCYLSNEGSSVYDGFMILCNTFSFALLWMEGVEVRSIVFCSALSGRLASWSRI